MDFVQRTLRFIVALGLAGRPASGDLHEVERRLFRLAVWSLVVALLSALL